MPRQTQSALLESKLDEARRLEADIRRLKNAAREKQQAEEQQRQKIVGRVVLSELKTQPDGELGKVIMALLAAKLTRTNERGLFPDLPGEAPCPVPADTSSAA